MQSIFLYTRNGKRWNITIPWYTVISFIYLKSSYSIFTEIKTLPLETFVPSDSENTWIFCASVSRNYLCSETFECLCLWFPSDKCKKEILAGPTLQLNTFYNTCPSRTEAFTLPLTQLRVMTRVHERI